MAEKTTVHVFQSKTDDELWYWHVRAENGEIVGASKSGELSEIECREQIEEFCDMLWDNIEPDYDQDSSGEWRWSIRTDIEIRGRSSEGFVERRGAQENFELVKKMMTRPLDIVVRGRTGEIDAVP